MHEVTGEMRSRRRWDAMTALMILITIAALVGSAWMRFGPGASSRPPAATVGSIAPILRLLDLETREPLVLVGLRGKVVWLVFWSAGSPVSPSCLEELEAVSVRLKSHRRFALVTAVPEASHTEQVRAAVAKHDRDLPVYLASSETLLRFGVANGDPPLHVLIDADGQIAAMVRGADRPTIQRLSGQVQSLLDELDPLGHTRYANAIIYQENRGVTR
jgi:hypothetical protein